MTASYDKEPNWNAELKRLTTDRLAATHQNGASGERQGHSASPTKQDLIDLAKAMRDEPAVWDYLCDWAAEKVEPTHKSPPNWLRPFTAYYILKHKPHLSEESKQVRGVIILMQAIATGRIPDIDTDEADASFEKILTTGWP